MDLSIIIVSFNTRELLRKCIDSICNSTKGLKYELIVIDNDSQDGSYEMLKNCIPQIRIIKNKVNLGFARAVNQGLKMAVGKYIALLNSDTLMVDNSLRVLVDYLEDNCRSLIVAPKLLNYDGSLFYSCRNFSNFFNQMYPLLPFFNRYEPKAFKLDIKEPEFYSLTREVDYVWGACIMFPIKITKDLGGLDERFFMYEEEEDFCYRAKHIGYKTIYYPKASVIHIGQGSASKDYDRSIKQLYYSKYLFLKKHHGLLCGFFFRLVTIIICLASIVSYEILGFLDKNKRERFDLSVNIRRLILGAYCRKKKDFYS